MMLRVQIVIILQLFFFASKAQLMEWGVLNQQEREMTSVEFEQDAGAVVLFHTGKLTFENNIGHEVTYRKRIKILSENGIEEANKAIYYYSGKKLESVEKFKAQTINISETGELIISEVPKSEFYKSDVSTNYSAVKWTFPDVKVGSILEYTYIKKSTGVTIIDSWEFQEELPTIYSKFSASFPYYYKYISLFQGRMIYQKYSGQPWPQDNSWDLRNIPSIQPDEPYLNNHSDYFEKIRLQLGAVRSLSRSEDVSGDWSSFAETIWEQDNIDNFISKKGKYKGLVDGMLLPGSDEKKAEILFDYVIQNYNWNDRYGMFPNSKINSFLESKKGNGSAMNMFLHGLLLASGLNSEPIIISTIPHGKAYKGSPFFTDFNHLILRVQISGKYYFLDCTAEGRLPFGMLPVNSNVVEGVLLQKKSSEWIEVKARKKAKDVVFVQVEFNESGFLEKSISLSLQDYTAEEYRMKLINNDSTIMLKDLYDAEDHKFESFKTRNLLDNEKSLKIQMNLVDENASLLDDETFYFGYNLLEELAENPFSREERMFPVEFKVAPNIRQVVSLEIPEGYEVVETPEPVTIRLPESEASFTFNSRIELNRVTISMDYVVAEKELHPELYPYFRMLYTKMVEKCSELVVLRKINE